MKLRTHVSGQLTLIRSILRIGVFVVVKNVVDKEIHYMDSSVAVVGKSLAA